MGTTEIAVTGWQVVPQQTFANTEALFRIIQSIPSKKAEPFKRWLAKVGYERVQEIEDPELAQKRMKEIYNLKGYSDEWVEKRVRGIAVRDELTDEWDQRGVKYEKEYAILTAEISKAAFGLTPGEYKRFKRLKHQNLRDHMDDIELILTMLGEATTTRFTRDRDSQKFPELRKDAKDGEMWQALHVGILRANWERVLFPAIIISRLQRKLKELKIRKRN